MDDAEFVDAVEHVVETAGLYWAQTGVDEAIQLVDAMIERLYTERKRMQADTRSALPDVVMAIAARTLDELPEIVRAERKRRGVSLQRAEEQIGYGYAAISKFENRKQTAQHSTLVRMLLWLSGVDRS